MMQPFASSLSRSSGSPSVELQPVCRTTEAPQKLLSRRGGIPEQQERAGNTHSNAPFTSKCQSFLDKLVAQIAHIEPTMIQWGRGIVRLPPESDIKCGIMECPRPIADNCLFIREPRHAKEMRLELKVRGSLTLTG